MNDFNLNDYDNYNDAAEALLKYFKSKEEEDKKEKKLEEARMNYAQAAARYFAVAFPDQNMDDVDTIYDSILSLEESSREFFKREEKLKNAKTVKINLDNVLTEEYPDWLKELKNIANDLKWTNIRKK